MGKETISSGEAGRLLEKAMIFFGNTGDEKYKKDIQTIVNMAGGLRNIFPVGLRRRVRKILGK